MTLLKLRYRNKRRIIGNLSRENSGLLEKVSHALTQLNDSYIVIVDYIVSYIVIVDSVLYNQMYEI